MSMGKEITFHNKQIKNFRDFGGYPTKDGKRVKEGFFFRSGVLAYIDNDEDRRLFQSLNIQTIFDLRSQSEREKLPDPNFQIRHYKMSAMIDEKGRDIDFSPQHILSFSNLSHMKKQPHHTYVQTYFIYFYSKILFQNKVVQTLFQELLEENAPILIHCSAGKDRTGIFAALILLALGVDQQTVIEDYCNSNFYRHTFIQQWLEKHRRLIKLFPKAKKIGYLTSGVLEESILLCIEMIHEKYSTFDEYISVEYGINKEKREKLKTLYLE